MGSLIILIDFTDFLCSASDESWVKDVTPLSPSQRFKKDLVCPTCSRDGWVDH